MSLSLILSPVSHVSAAEGEKSVGGYMNQVLGIGTGIIGTSILLDCKLGSKTPSILLFFGGALVYIASEIMGAKSQNAFLKASTEEVDNLVKNSVQGGDAQKGIIEAKLKEEEKKLEFVNKRKTWMMAITAIFFAATAMAVVEHFKIDEWTSASCAPFGPSLPINKLQIASIGAAFSFASGASGGGMISGLIAAITAAVIVYKGTLVPSMNIPTTRIVSFGVASALSTGIILSLSGEAKKIEENISKLKSLLGQFKQNTKVDGPQLADGSLPPASNQDSDRPNIDPANYAVTALPNGIAVANHCWSNSANGGMDFSENCKNPAILPRPNFNADLNLPSLTSVGNAAGDFAQAVADGNNAQADVLAGSLAANAGRMKQLKDNLLKQMNDKLKAEGKKPIDFDGEVKKQIADMGAAVNNHLAGKGIPQISGGGAAALGSDLKADQSQASTGEVVTSKSQGGESQPKALNLNEGSLTEEVPAQSSVAIISQGLEDFETSESDISKRPEESIFKQLSTRYLLNYTKFFEKKKIEEAKASP